MKTFKKIAFTLLCIVSLTLNSCSSGCENGNPTVLVTNNGTGEVSVQVKTTGGSTENLNNIPSGESSDLRQHAEGIVTYTIVLENKTELNEVLTLSACEDYLVTVNTDDTISLTSSSRD